MKYALLPLLACGLLFCTVIASGQETGNEINLPDTQESEIVTFPAGFFEQYQPLTALDMARLVPGFQIDDGEDLRGFGNAAGNILINDKRPSAKQDPASAILSRIPAASVDRIELIRGKSGDVNMQGYSIVANVILYEDVFATSRWQTSMIYTSPSPFGLGAGLSYANQMSGIDFNIGIDLERYTNGITGTVERYDAQEIQTELRVDEREQSGIDLKGIYLNASGLLGGTLYHLNTRFGYRDINGSELSSRTLLIPGEDDYDVFFIDEDTRPQFEIGLDGERALTQDLQAKGILVFTHEDEDAYSSQESVDTSGTQTLFRQAGETTRSLETITRLELDWTGWTGHTVTASIEGAYNLLDNSLLLTDDTGNGAVTVDVPNANSIVKESRGEILLNDSWSPGRWNLDYGLGAEVSNIRQQGDVEQQRDFFFVKPTAVLTFAHDRQHQSRMRIAREVAQLDFSDFVSSAIFVDDDLALGNPDLKPETTWIAEISHERRYGDLGVVKLTGFHHWIKDVMDLLPVSDRFEVPGNLGAGRRWGVEFETTVPMTWLNLTGARLDIRARWQDSTVTDPVTGNTRKLSANGGFSGQPTIHFYSENDYVVDIAYRQDFETSGWAWGWDTAVQDERLLYKVNELEGFEEGVELNAFVETTAWLGMKIRLEGNNLLDYLEVRDRLIFDGRRDLTPLQQRELRLRKPSRVYTLTFSGSF